MGVRGDGQGVLVVIPTYNEAASLAGVLEGVVAAAPQVEVLVVDDASPDGTGALAAQLATQHAWLHVLHRAGKFGLASAYRDGFSWGLERGYEVLGEMDADGSHRAEDLTKVLSGLSGADIVIGSRYVPGGGVVDWSRSRRALSRGGNLYVRLCTGAPVRDATSGLRLLRREVVEALPWDELDAEGYAFQVETALHAWRLGFRIAEVPITFVERRHGASKISRRIVAEAMWRVPRWALRNPGGRRAPQPVWQGRAGR